MNAHYKHGVFPREIKGSFANAFVKCLLICLDIFLFFLCM